LQNAMTNATIKSNAVAMLLATAHKIALLIRVALILRPAMSVFKFELAPDRSIIRLSRPIRIARKAASAPSRKAGAVACAITFES